MPEASAREVPVPPYTATDLRRYRLRQRIALRLIIFAGYWVIRLIGPTLRVCISREDGAQETLDQRPLLQRDLHDTSVRP